MNIPLMKKNKSNPVRDILAGKVEPGIYRLETELNADFMVAPLDKHGWHGFYIEGQVVKSKDDFLRMAGAAMSFPDYYARNWDAFEECIRDLSWARAEGYVLIYEEVWPFPRADRKAWRQARTILADTIDFWGELHIPFYVLLRHTWWYAHDIPRL